MDRRSETRVKRNASVKYRIAYMGTYKIGLLVNITSHGALLWLKEDLSIGSNLEVLMLSDNYSEHVHMNVVRTEETNRDGYTGYGCKIEMRISEAA